MPTPRGFAVMPGSFDCPEATDSITPLSRQHSIHGIYDRYQVPDSEIEPGGAISETGMDRDNSSERFSELNTLRRRINNLRRLADQDSGAGRPTAEATTAASAPARWAPRASVPRRSRLHQHRLRRRTEDDSIGTVQEAVDRLNEANSDLSSILDEPLPQIVSSDDLMALVPDAVTMERRHKRRKLDSDALDAEPPPRYGYYGQVVPGRLNMSILGCDGGSLTERDENSHHRHYSPENVLRNDKSVYCTEKDQCNIVLKHWKETPFALTKVVIKTPDMGFTAPVQEGLIFVSLSSESLISRTSHYQIAQPPPVRLPPNHPPVMTTHTYGESVAHRRRAEFVSRYANLRQFAPPPTGDTRPPSRRRNSALYPSIVYPAEPPDPALEHQHRAWNSNELEGASVQSHQPFAEDRSLFIQSDSGEFKVTATCDEPSGDEEEVTSPAVLLDRQRRRRLGLEWPSSEDEDTDGSISRNRRLRWSPRDIKAVRQATGSEESYVDMLEPHARFFIERKRNVVSIKFHPPVSGRYVLVKMWSPQNRDNIDIQSISIYGYAGPRFIPAIQPR